MCGLIGIAAASRVNRSGVGSCIVHGVNRYGSRGTCPKNGLANLSVVQSD